MPLQYLQTLFALAIFLLVIGSGLLPFLKKIKDASHHHDYSFAETVATGIFLGAALLHILPDSNQMFVKQDISYPISYLIAGLTFLFFLWLEHLSKELYQSTLRQHTFIIVAWMMLSVHSFFEGSALGFTKDLSMLAVLFVAIISHKWAEGFAMAVQLTKHDLSHRSNLILYLIYALMTPIGVFLGYHFSGPSSDLFSPVCMAISGGTFLYFGTLHGLERCVLVKGCCNLKHFSFVILGFLLMAIVA